MIRAGVRMETQEVTTFSTLGLRKELIDTLSELGYEAPTPIQEKTIPIILAGHDVIGQAQTGTGKTAAFALPMLERLDPANAGTQALVLTPTRELAMQVAEAIHSYGKKLRHISVLPVYGGAPIVNQLKRLERGVQIVVGTPGRLIDHLERKSLNLSAVRMIVLDEADEMLRMGFIDDVEQILGSAPESRQTALFSATMPAGVRRIAERHLRDPQRIEVEHKTLTAPAIEQRALNVSEGQKLEVLTQILELEPATGVLVFRRTKTGAAELAEKLEARGFSAVAMHGDMTQSLREAVLRRFRNGQVEILVATDVAARGLDVEQITHVINYDIPSDVEVYVHRIGRTGRAGRSGVATLFVTPRERRMLREIERFTGKPITPMKMPSRADVAARRIEVFKESVRATLAAGDLDLYVGMVEQIADEGPFDIADVAAAAMRLASQERPLAAAPEEEILEERRPPKQAYSPARGAGSTRPSPPASRKEPRGKPPRSDEDRDAGPKVRLSIGVGKNDGIRPADIVGSIANEADVPGREIGPIDIRDDVTYVVVPEKYRDQVLERTAGAKFRGRSMRVRIAGSEDADRAKPFSPAGPRSRSAVPRRDQGERSRPAPAYGRKPYGAASRPASRPAGPRARGVHEKESPPRPHRKGDAPRSRAAASTRQGRPAASRASSPARERSGDTKPFYSKFGSGPSKGRKSDRDRPPPGGKKRR
ncbi:MAG TPA: DEAD/DEAH box helicase [Thermoanaerobaculia bacterium]|nr:DEAD/DEAH box helicase [Thermoanaerobaculia bacterium]